MKEIPFILAGSALSLAAIAAQPLPKLATGTQDSKEGLHILGDANKSELVMEPDGSMYVTGDKPEIRHLKRHTVVMPDAEKALNYFVTAATNGDDDGPGGIVIPGFDNLNSTMNRGFNAMIKAVRSKGNLVLRRDMNKDLLMRYGKDYWRYIN